MLAMEVYEREATALGAKADAWMDGELATEKDTFDEAAKSYEASLESKNFLESREALARMKETRDAYYEKKRGLAGQLRENGQDLEWTTGGTATPARVGETIQYSANLLPKDWIDNSNRLSTPEEVANNRTRAQPILPVRVRESTGRNHYSERNFITKRETKIKQSFWNGNDSYVKNTIMKSPRYGIVPPEEYSEAEKKHAYRGEILVREYDVARQASFFDSSSGAGALDENGKFTLTGRAAAGWQEHNYTDEQGVEKTVWRKPRTQTSTNRQYGIAELTIPKGAGRKGHPNSTATHELIHRCENTNPTIPAMESVFVKRRTTEANGEREPLQRYYSGSSEMMRPDDFIDRYVGKEYKGSRYYEVMSVGTEATFHGSHGGFGKLSDPSLRTPQRKDDDHHAFVLGTYMTA